MNDVTLAAMSMPSMTSSGVTLETHQNQLQTQLQTKQLETQILQQSLQAEILKQQLQQLTDQNSQQMVRPPNRSPCTYFIQLSNVKPVKSQ